MDENRRRYGGGARPRERNGRALRNFTRRRSTGSQTRAMDEMLTRRETIDYSRQDRGRQVGREMAFLCQSGLRHRFCASSSRYIYRETHLFSALLRYARKNKVKKPPKVISFDRIRILVSDFHEMHICNSNKLKISSKQ